MLLKNNMVYYTAHITGEHAHAYYIEPQEAEQLRVMLKSGVGGLTLASNRVVYLIEMGRAVGSTWKPKYR